MKELNIETKLFLFKSIKATPIDVQELMEHAIAARKKAYAPYSNFFVGAALALNNGEIITGSNQENASYPSGLCAERTAIFYAGAKYPNATILTIAISAASQNKKTDMPIPPCGACRQSIAEYETKQKTPIQLYFMGETGQVIKSNSLNNLLPFGFSGSNL